ncbi:uncharacterized protein Z518_03325 [Rhinocladiella mackenziei CBS 650.93]|uniref:SnoaL-like domain-containing protein n=1 Tax=Rhinocladiella mackenziei CBS 650.93 TaxID=1442369 RepID=A0A0D2HDP2_9EURO|nr:uncharacterized protein Z518_03325 [Rhinocladiella mackenziei CBS 650.93]KIX08668.1 hypothetical protein Z518_03325 [Rhinocladiella mackenziei CBS 650.93]
MTKYTTEHFLGYIKAFNAKDWDVQHSYYAKDVVLDLPRGDNLPTYRGSEGIKSHYGPLLDKFTETIVPIELMIEEDRIFFIMETSFQAKTETIGPSGFTCTPGDIIRVTVWAFYKMEGGLMKTITTNQLHGEFIGKRMTLEETIKDSQSRAARPELILD